MNDENVLCSKCQQDYLVLLHKNRGDNDDFCCPSVKKYIGQ